MAYFRDSLTLEVVQFVLHFRSLQNKLELKIEIGEGLSIRGRTKKYNLKVKTNNNDRSKSKSRQLKCFNYHKE